MKKILIVDDSPSMRMVLRDILERKQKQKKKQDEEHYNFFEAGSEEQALTQFTKESPDLILLDIVMSGGDEVGVTVLKKIKAINPKVAVVMISAVGQGPTIAECAKLGAIDYIVKPFDDSEVLEVVARSLSL